MKDYRWLSDLSGYMIHYIETKRMAGYKFEAQERVLQHFDSFLFYNGYEDHTITKRMIEEFIYIKKESSSTKRNKEIILNQFCQYLYSLGIHTHIPEIKTPIIKCNYIPYIFTKEEVKRLFIAIDSFPIIQNSSRNTVDPVLFRFLYSTGVRISEALNIRIEDIHIVDNYVVIKKGKNNKDRIVPFTESMSIKIKNLIDNYYCFSDSRTFLFSNNKMEKMNQSTAYNHFREYLLMADIPHNKQGPRIHSFRHGFAVECLRRWVNEKEDLYNMLPYLSAYMGHSDFRATQYYLRLTAELYPELVKMVEEQCGYIIPEVANYEKEK